MTNFRRHLLVFLVLLGLGLFFYGLNLNDFFLSDDFDWLDLTINPQTPFLYKLAGNYYGLHQQGGSFRPMFNVIFSLETKLFGLKALGYHVVSLLFHIASAFLIYLVALGLFEKRKSQKPLAILASLIFCLMPSHTEAVVWIASIGDPMATCFYLSAFYLYIDSRSEKQLELNVKSISQRPAGRGSETKKVKYWDKKILIVLSFGLALLTKEVALTLPFLLLGYELIIKRNFQIKDLIKKLWQYFAMALGYVLYRFWAIGLGWGYYGAETIGFNVRQYLEMFVNLLMNNFLFDSYRLATTEFIIRFWPVPTLLITIILVGLIVAFFRKNYQIISFIIFFWLLNIVLVLPLGFGLTADEGQRYGYLSSVAIAILMAWVITWVWQKKKSLGFLIFIFFITYFGYNLRAKTLYWDRASSITENMVKQLKQIDFNSYKKTYFVGLPETFHGAQVMRNGIGQAVALFTDNKKPIERVPVYVSINKNNVDQSIYNNFQRLADGFHVITINNQFILTGNATEILPEYKFELWNYDYVNKNADTLRLQFINGREFDWARKEIQVIYFEQEELKNVNHDY